MLCGPRESRARCPTFYDVAIDWSVVVRRLLDEGLVSELEETSLHLDSRGFLHGRADCAGRENPVRIPLRALGAIAADQTCDCGGWLSSPLGAVVAYSARLHEIEEFYASGAFVTDWFELYTRIIRHRSPLLSSYDHADGRLRRIAERSAELDLLIAERSRVVLDPVVLHRALASQSLCFPVTHAEATVFSAWARSLRIERLRTYEGFRAIVPRVEAALTEYIAARGDALVFVALHDSWAARFGDTRFPWSAPPELAMLLWWECVALPTGWLIVPAAVAEGLLAIVPAVSVNGLQVAVGSCPTDPGLDPAVLDLALVLWRESAENFADLDEVLDVAQRVQVAPSAADTDTPTAPD